MIRVGDTITYRPGLTGKGAPKQVKVLELTLTQEPREKYGEDVQVVHEVCVRENLVCFGLSDGHWCYSDQVILEVDDAERED